MKYACIALAALGALPALSHAEPTTENPWLVRGRVINIDPRNDGGTTSIGGKPSVGSQWAPEVDLSYFLNKSVAVELIAATTKHDVKVNKKPAVTDLGSVWVLPPTLTVQYHKDICNWKPYVGAGVTYAHFYNAEHPGLGSVKYDNAWGAALQAGVDYKLTPKVYLNADLKQIFLKTDVTVNDTITAKANLNPTVIGVGVGYRF